MLKAKARLILHVGLHKTATTSIQYSLRKNRKFLAKKGFLVPKIKSHLGMEIINSAILIVSAFWPKNKRFYKLSLYALDEKKIRKRALSCLAACFASNQDIVISAEQFSLLPKEVLVDFRQYVKKHNYDIEVMCFVREPMSFLHSFAQEKIKHGATLDSLDKHNIISHASRQIINLKTVFKEECQFYHFNDAIKSQGGIVSYFFKQLGIDISVCNFKQKHRNQAISYEAIDLLSYINQLSPNNILGRPNITRDYKEHQALLAIPGIVFRLPSEASLDVAADEEIEKIYQLTGLSFKRKTKTEGELPLWQPKAIEALIKIIPRLNKTMVIRIHDYCYQALKKRRMSHDDFQKIHQVIEKTYFKRKRFRIINGLFLLLTELKFIIRPVSLPSDLKK